MNYYELNVSIPLITDKPIDCENLSCSLDHELNDYFDEGLSFHSQMVTEGLLKCIKDAIKNEIKRQAQKKYGNEVVYSVAVWHMVSEGQIKMMPKTSFNGFYEVKINEP